MKVIETNSIFENPLPQLVSRQSIFPSLCQLPDGTLAAAHVIGQAFESADQVPYISFSTDGSKTWTKPQQMFDFKEKNGKFSGCAKITLLPDGRLIAIGYGHDRLDPELPVGNPENGGLLDDMVFCSFSADNGKTWSDPTEIECSWGPHVEASGPIVVLKDGTLITPITGFPGWDGKMTGPICGKALRSEDNGKTWEDSSVCMAFENGVTTCYEQRMCQLDSGVIINIGWNQNTVTGERYDNHYTYSADNGKTWSAPITTGVRGQASSVCALGGEKLLALHAVRRDTDRPGIYAYVIDFSDKTWKVVDEAVVWEPTTPLLKDTKMAESFAFLKFGQPSAIKLKDGDLLMTHWYAQDGLYRTVATRIKL